MLSLNKSYKKRKVSLTIHCKYKYFGSTVQKAEDRRQKFYFFLLPLTSSLTSLALKAYERLHTYERLYSAASVYYLLFTSTSNSGNN